MIVGSLVSFWKFVNRMHHRYDPVSHEGPRPAVVCKVHPDGSANLAVFNEDGTVAPHQGVRQAQIGFDKPMADCFDDRMLEGEEMPSKDPPVESPPYHAPEHPEFELESLSPRAAHDG